MQITTEVEMRTFLTVSIVCVGIALFGFRPEHVIGQEKATLITPADGLKKGWEKFDDRLMFLMVRLANVETSLEAIDKVVAAKRRQQSLSKSKARGAEKKNEQMDRNAGGPVHWSVFYGTTAEKFFYHPVDQKTTYHTRTILQQLPTSNDSEAGKAVHKSNGVPTDQRPPQFDYIYRANDQTKERAEQEAQQLGSNIDAAVARQRKLEGEQATLWCQIALRAVSRYDLPKKPIYRFVSVPTEPDSRARQRADGLKSAALFTRTALSIVAKAEENQAKAFADMRSTVSEAKGQLDDVFLREDIFDTTTVDLKSSEGRFAALAKHLEDVASNLSDSYKVAMDGDQAGDQLRKDTFRRLLQDSLLSYAETVLALDEMSVVLAREWKTKPALDQPLLFVSAVVASDTQNPAPEATPQSNKSTIDKDTRSRWTNTSYGTTIYQVNGKQWGEIDNKTKGKKWDLAEIERNPDYVVLHNPTLNMIWRLSAAEMERKDGEGWTWISHGHWDRSAGAGDNKPVTAETEVPKGEPLPVEPKGGKDTRSLWINTSYGGLFELSAPGQWVEKGAKDEVRFRFKEIGRTVDYVELFDSNRNMPLRLLTDRLQIKKGDGWEGAGNGHWGR